MLQRAAVLNAKLVYNVNARFLSEQRTEKFIYREQACANGSIWWQSYWTYIVDCRIRRRQVGKLCHYELILEGLQNCVVLPSTPSFTNGNAY